MLSSIGWGMKRLQTPSFLLVRELGGTWVVHIRVGEGPVMYSCSEGGVGLEWRTLLPRPPSEDLRKGCVAFLLNYKRNPGAPWG